MRGGPRPAAIGFSPHSGWAAAVAVVIEGGDPRAVLRERFEMADPSLPGAAQPYHAAEGLGLARAERLLDRFRQTAGAMARAAIAGLVSRLRDDGCETAAGVILEGGGRRGGSLEAILASHPLIHTADGNHFRDAIAEACQGCGVRVVRIPSKQLPESAARALGMAADALRERVAALGRPLGPPWGADQKSAALAAWMALAGAAGAPRIRRRA